MAELVVPLLLAVSSIGVFNCIVRSDYNVVIGLVSLFYWSNRASKTKRVATLMMMILAASLVLDIIWILLVWKGWTTDVGVSAVWKKLRFLHKTVLLFSVVNLFVKGAAAFFLWKEGQTAGPANYKELNDLPGGNFRM